jgi:hypothetical protein
MMDVAEAYGIIDRALVDGLYLGSITLGKVPIVIRALSEQETEYLRISIQGLPYDKLIAHIAAACIVSVAGHNLVDMSATDRTTLLGIMENLPPNFPAAIAEAHNELRSRLNEASSFWEGFCSTSYSRRLWRIRKEKVGPAFSGVPGASFIPLYSIQAYWVMYNNQMDQRDERGFQYQMALLQASATNPKGAEKLINRRNREVEDQEEERRKLVFAGIRSELDTIKERELDGWAGKITSNDQLIKEVKRMAEGVKDKHDLFIEEFREKQRQERIRKLEEEMEKARKAMQYRQQRANTETVVLGLTPELIRRRLRGENLESVKEAVESLAKDKVLIKRPNKSNRRL